MVIYYQSSFKSIRLLKLILNDQLTKSLYSQVFMSRLQNATVNILQSLAKYILHVCMHDAARVCQGLNYHKDSL